MVNKPRLFGLTNSNRDFSLKDTWGKNQFNSSFPIALCCYMASKEIDVNYLISKNNQIKCQSISVNEVFGVEADSQDIFFAFETAHTPFAKYVVGSLPRTDIVIQNIRTGQCLTGLEIKLTALPDHTTCHLSDEFFGSEIVIRPDSIVYLACSIAENFGQNLNELIVASEISGETDWSDPKQVIPLFNDISITLNNLCRNETTIQKPFLIQPVWKTIGKSPRLAENCLDVFVWSDLAFVRFILSIADLSENCLKITRPTRTAIWLYKMLLDICQNGKFNHEQIIDTCSFNTKNDKAFSSSGQITNPFMKSTRLETPIILKSEIKKNYFRRGTGIAQPRKTF